MKIIELGIIGYGRIAKTHIEAIALINSMQQEYRVNLYSCLSTHPENVPAGLFEKVTRNQADFFEDEKLMVVDICTPNMNHLEEVQLAHQNKKLIYCEKPLTTSIVTADFIKDYPYHQVALVNRFNPAVIKMKLALEQGIIGDLIHFKTLNYHDSYLSSERPISWRQKFKLSGGGASMDLGIHSFDLVRFIVGELNSVSAFMKTAFNERYADDNKVEMVENDTDEYMALICTTPQHEVGIIESSRVSKAMVKQPTFEISGTKGSIVILDNECIYYNALTKQQEPLKVNSTPFYDFVTQVTDKLPEVDPFVKLHLVSLHSLFVKMTVGVSFSEAPSFLEAYKSQIIVEKALQSANLKQVLPL